MAKAKAESCWWDEVDQGWVGSGQRVAAVVLPYKRLIFGGGVGTHKAPI